MSKHVLDASAVLALINGEAGGDKVEPLLDKAVMSAVNFSEVIHKLVLGGVPVDEAVEVISDLIPKVVPFEKEVAVLSVALTPVTKAFGLSLGDRACLATAKFMGLEAVTADRVWGKVKVGIKIRLIR